MTIVNNQGGFTVPWYDRITAVVSREFTDDTAPHVDIQRWIYTVPANKRARVGMFQIGLCRRQPPSTSNRFTAEIRYTPSGGTIVVIAASIVTFPSSGQNQIVAFSPSLFVAEGDELVAVTTDRAVGGLMNVAILIVLNEFDL